MTPDLATMMRAMARTAMERMWAAADHQTATIIGVTALEMLAALPDAPAAAARPQDPPPPRDAEAPPSTQPAGADTVAESTEDPQQPAQDGAGPAAQPQAQGDDAPAGEGPAETPQSPGGTSDPQGRRATETERSHAAVPTGGRPAPQAPARAGTKPGKWTPERRALLRDELWYALPRQTEGQMRRALNALPGNVPIAPGQVGAYATGALHLHKRSGPEWQVEAERRQAAAAAQAGASRDTPSESGPGEKPEAAPPARPREPSPQRHGHQLPAQNKHEAEAKQMLREGWTARQVAEEFGEPMATVSLWQLQVRKEAEA